jgi:DNA-binding PadR family transcriptional regulator
VVGQLGHSRKLPLRELLQLVGDGQPSWYLKPLAMLAYPVVERTVEQALCDLEWGGFLTRTRAREGDRRAQIVCLTPLGREALTNLILAATLDSLPQRHRRQRDLPADPDRGRVVSREWEGFHR